MQGLMTAGMTVSWADYHVIPNIVWHDLILWKEVEINKSNKDDGE